MLTISTEDLETIAHTYDPATQGTIGNMGSSYCNIDESIGVPFNSSSDSKQDD